MTDLAAGLAREFYVGPGGNRWLLACDAGTGKPFVIHRPGQDEMEVEFDLGSFLVLFEGQERDGLLRLIASLVPDAAAARQDESVTVRSARPPPRSWPRWSLK